MGAVVRRRVLGRLVQARVLGTLERRIGGVRAGSQGLVFFLDVAGVANDADRVSGCCAETHQHKSHQKWRFYVPALCVRRHHFLRLAWPLRRYRSA